MNPVAFHTGSLGKDKSCFTHHDSETITSTISRETSFLQIILASLSLSVKISRVKMYIKRSLFLLERPQCKTKPIMFSDDLLFTTGCSAFVSSPGRWRRHWNLQSCLGRYINHQHGTKVTKCKEIIKQKLLLFRLKGSNRRYFQSSKLPSRKTKALHKQSPLLPSSLSILSHSKIHKAQSDLFLLQ